MECPICLTVPVPPIYQCANGHIVCSDCLRKITTCGVCRERLPGKPIRSLVAEQLAETITKLSISKSRERLTSYCNLPGLNEFLDCKKSIRRDEFGDHMKQHGINGVKGTSGDVIQELGDFSSPQIWFPVYFEAHDEIFFLMSETQMDCSHSSSLLVSWKCGIVGDSLTAKEFCLQLCLTNKDKEIKNLFDCPITGIESQDDCVGSQVFLPLAQLEQFGKYNEGNKLEWTISVQIGKKSENTDGFQKFKPIWYIAKQKVKTSSLPLKIKHLIHPLNIIRSSKSGNIKVFMDLAYDNELIGRLVIELRNDILPFTSENFRSLCTGEKGFGYKGSCFFRINVNNYIMGGDITKEDGTGGISIYGDTFKNENFSLKHSEKGIISMYNGKGNINANGSVFMITLKEQPGWDGEYVAFGKVVDGMEVLDELEKLEIFFDGQYTRNKKTTIQSCGQCVRDPIPLKMA